MYVDPQEVSLSVECLSVCICVCAQMCVSVCFVIAVKCWIQSYYFGSLFAGSALATNVPRQMCLEI